MLDDTKRDSDALRVLNVAITRARDKLYLVANTKRLLAELGGESLLSRILHHFEERAECLESASLVDDYFATDFDRWASELLGAPRTDGEPVSGELYTERNFWAQFLRDIGGVQQRLMILSPFMSVNRAGKLVDYFKAMIERGVDVRVYTRPANQQSGEMAGQSATVLTQLHAIGASVIERRNMHQKVAVLDDSIVWEGSLNILSHRDSGEQMRRFVSQSAVEDISRNLELDEKHAVGVQTSEQCPGPDGGGCEHDGYLIVRRNRRRGTRFLGCSAFPKCRYTEPLRQAG